MDHRALHCIELQYKILDRMQKKTTLPAFVLNCPPLRKGCMMRLTVYQIYIVCRPSDWLTRYWSVIGNLLQYIEVWPSTLKFCLICMKSRFLNYILFGANVYSKMEESKILYIGQYVHFFIFCFEANFVQNDLENIDVSRATKKTLVTKS